MTFTVISLVLPLGSAFHGFENNTAWVQMKEGIAGECVEPATCQPPDAKYSWVGAVQSRQQWGDSGGFCGALSIQAIAMNYGAYISQDKVACDRMRVGGGRTMP